MIGIVLVSHSAEIAAGLAQLAAQMAGPDVRIVPAGGLEAPGALGTDAARVARAIEDAWSEDGVLVLMDLGSALLSTEFALDLLEEERRGKVLLTAAPLVEGAVAAAVAAGLGDPLEACAEAARRGLEAKAAQLGEERGGESGAGAVVAGATGSADATAARTASGAGGGETATGSSASPADEGAAQAPAATIRVTVTPALGLHARPAALLVRTTGRFDAQVTVADLSNARGPVSARSLTAVSLLGAEHGDELLVTAAGPQAAEALQAVRRLADDCFGEPPAAKPAPADGDDRGPGEPVCGPPAAKPAPAAEAGAGAARPAGARAAAPRAGTVLHGVAASPGVAVGPAQRVHLAARPSPGRGPAPEPQAEWDALGAALAGAAGEIAAARERVTAARRPHDAAIFDAHLLFLEDEGLLEAARTGIFGRRLSASQAWADAVAAAAAQWDELRDAYQRERAADLRAVGDQVLARIAGPEGEAVADGPDGGAAGRTAADEAGAGVAGDAPVGPAAGTSDESPSEPAVLVARDLSPAQVAAIDTAQVAGIACSAGGPASHAAILARALGIAAVVGAGPALLEVPEGTVLQVDGDAGTVTVEPDDVRPRRGTSAAPRLAPRPARQPGRPQRAGSDARRPDGARGGQHRRRTGGAGRRGRRRRRRRSAAHGVPVHGSRRPPRRGRPGGGLRRRRGRPGRPPAHRAHPGRRRRQAAARRPSRARGQPVPRRARPASRAGESGDAARPAPRRAARRRPRSAAGHVPDGVDRGGVAPAP